MGMWGWYGRRNTVGGGGQEGEKGERKGGVESGDQDVERKFSVKVFANKRIIMQRSHSTTPPPPFLFLCHCHLFSLPLFFSFLVFSSFFPPSALLTWPWFPPHSNQLLVASLSISITLFIFCCIPVFFICVASAPLHSSSPFLFFPSSSRP